MSNTDHPNWVLPDLIHQLTIAKGPDQLVELALARRGFGNSDIGLGVLYAEPDCPELPSGHVEVYVGWGAPEGFEAITTEDNYLCILAEVLRAKGAVEAAATLEAFRNGLT